MSFRRLKGESVKIGTAGETSAESRMEEMCEKIQDCPRSRESIPEYRGKSLRLKSSGPSRILFFETQICTS